MVGRKTEIDWPRTYTNLNDFIIQGQSSKVHVELDRLNLKRIPRELKFQFGDLAWRAGNSLATLKILHSVLFPQNRFAKAAADNEKLVYASALVQLGAVNEALEIFSSIDCRLSDVLLRKAFAHFKVWDYVSAAPLLEEYILRADLSPYQKVVGKVNLAAAHIFLEKWQMAEDLLGELVQECIENKYKLLLGNCYELFAQLRIFNARYDDALSFLEKARENLVDQKGEFLFFVEKWSAVACGLKGKKSKETFALLKMRAQELRQWENIRELDLFDAIVCEDENLLKRVIVGTPFKIYRARARKLFGRNLQPQGTYTWTIGEVENDENFNPYRKDDEALFRKANLLALYQALTKDFYKPSHIGLLFECVYPDESFNPHSSPNRVLQLLRRLNEWFIENGSALRVRLEKSEFCLTTVDNKKVNIVMGLKTKLTKQKGHLQLLKSVIKDRSFNSKIVSDTLGISRSSANKILLEALSKRAIVQLGSGRSTTYRFANPRVGKAA